MNEVTIPTWPCRLIQHDYLNDNPVGMNVKADLVFADPPYNQGIKYKNDPTKDRMSPEDYREFTRLSIAHLRGMARPGATFWWMTTEEHADWTGQMLTDLVGQRIYRIVWHEAFAQYQGNKGLTKDYRFIFCHVVRPEVTTAKDWGRDLMTWNPDNIRIPSARQTVYKDKRANGKGRVPGCVWNIRRLQGTSVDHVDWHPCQLPPELLARIVHGWSNEGDVVLDGFAGSGSLAKVCRQFKRGFVGIDRSETYLTEMERELQ